MSTIVQLDQNTINKIAAGEVIERPSAVVKELVENAIDAKANAITVEIKDGGISLVRITDNGRGIANDDIKIAFHRHATSKITSVEDLFMVKSLGFRGEALSSIAAVAQVELITKTESDLTGTRYVIEGGYEKEFESIGCPDGTTFVVRNLFFNTPVRRKFLKTSHTEAGYVYELLERLSVSHPDISFKFINNGQIKLQTSGNNKLKDIVYSIYGREIYDNMLEIYGERKNVSVKGFVGKPIISRGNRNYENYFINGRYIKSNIIFKAIEEAYKPYSMVHRYPFVSLHLSINQELIDVNVHPTKMEIRFANSHEVYEVVYTTIKNALENSKRIPEVELIKEKEEKTEYKSAPEPFEVNRKKEEAEQIIANETIKGVGETNNSYSFIKADDVTIKEGFSREKYAKDAKNRDELREDMIKLEEKKNIFDFQIFKTDTISEKKADKNCEFKYKMDEENIQTKKAKGIRENVEINDENVKQNSLQNTSVDEKIPNDLQSKSVDEEIPNDLQSKSVDEEIPNDLQSKSIDEETPNDLQSTSTDENSNLHKTKKEENIQNELQQKNNDNKQVQQYVKTEQVSMFEEIEEKKQIRIVGQVFDTYWIVEYDDKMFIIDQHAAHEKVMYERIVKSHKDKKHNSQIIAPPIVISLNMREESILKKNIDVFKKMGFEIEHFGGKDYKISAVPMDMYGIADKVLFMEILDSLLEQDYKKTPNIILEKIASMSCKAAVKGNNRLSMLEAKELISEMMELENPYNCPHGRPTIIELTKKELEKKFKRQL